MEQSKYLQLARQAKAENNSEDAKAYYNKVREEYPENGEAKFFYAYYSLYEGKNIEVPTKFINLCKSVISSVRMIKDSEESKEEQLKAIEEIVDVFVPATWTINKFMNKKNHETKIGDSFVKIFDNSEIISCGKGGMVMIRELGDELATLYGEDMEAKRLAAIAWKEYVSLAQKWYAWAPKGEAEVYAEKIKQIEPSYEMPQKAGCISSANKKQ